MFSVLLPSRLIMCDYSQLCFPPVCLVSSLSLCIFKPCVFHCLLLCASSVLLVFFVLSLPLTSFLASHCLVHSLVWFSQVYFMECFSQRNKATFLCLSRCSSSVFGSSSSLPQTHMTTCSYLIMKNYCRRNKKAEKPLSLFKHIQLTVTQNKYDRLKIIQLWNILSCIFIF